MPASAKVYDALSLSGERENAPLSLFEINPGSIQILQRFIDVTLQEQTEM